MEKLNQIASKFRIDGVITEIAPLGKGNINDTFRIKTVGLPTPSFHCPEYFGTLDFE